MSFIDTVPPAEAVGAVRAMYERQQAKWGYVPNYARAFSARPELMPLWADLLAGIRRHIEPRRFELATLAAAVALGNSYCALAHGRALCKFLSPREVRAIADAVARREVPDVLSPLDAAVVCFAARAARHASAIEAADVAALREHGLQDAEIFDLAATVAARAFFAGLLDSTGAEADAPYGSELEQELLTALVVGRPIAGEPPESLA